MRSPETVAGMACPVCKTGLAMSERQGIEIDYCPNCRGIWLDRGELDKIIERSATAEPPAAPVPPTPPAPPQPPSGYAPGYAPPPPPSPWGGGRGDWDRGSDHRYGKKRRKSFLEELFD
jgi:Zn-finger nucleic acid-binding protein